MAFTLDSAMNTLDTEALIRLAETLGTVHGSDLAAHLKRDAVLLVAPDLDLMDAAVAVASDDATQVGAWLGDGRLRRPTPAEHTAWLGEPERRWRAIVVQPFVFIQSIE
jgi:hypothetical protein